MSDKKDTIPLRTRKRQENRPIPNTEVFHIKKDDTENPSKRVKIPRVIPLNFGNEIDPKNWKLHRFISSRLICCLTEGFTEVDLVMNRPVRMVFSKGVRYLELSRKKILIYHSEVFDLKSCIQLRPGGQHNLPVVDYYGFFPDIQQKKVLPSYLPALRPNELVRKNTHTLLGDFLKDGRKLKCLHSCINDDKDYTFLTDQIIVMPESKIEKEYIYGENMEKLFDYLYCPIIIEGAYEITTEKYDECQCYNCIDDSEGVSSIGEDDEEKSTDTE